MSSPLAIATVTAVLRDLLNNGLIDHNIVGALGSNVTVSAVPPDTIPVGGTNAKSQLNLFLHQVSPNAALRNSGLPSRDSRGARLGNPPLALDLHYLLTAYGAEELHSEILLGYGMYLMHERPVLDRKAIRAAVAGTTVDTSILPLAYQALSAADLADQLEQIKITPVSMATEEMSKLWSAMQAHYRPSAAYSISVVLIEADKATRSALPVLTRGPRDGTTGRETGITATAGLVPPYPGLTRVEPPKKQLAAVPGDSIILHGHHLNGSNLEARFYHPLLGDPITVPIGINVNSDKVSVTLPNDAAASIGWPPGNWTVELAVQRPGETKLRISNSLPMMLAPILDIPVSNASRDAGTGAVTIHLVFTPELRQSQQVRLAAGGHEALPSNLSSQTGTLDFVYPELPANNQWLRLRVDGVDSLLVNREKQPPEFHASQHIVIPA
jgi:hypothetical protein